MVSVVTIQVLISILLTFLLITTLLYMGSVITVQNYSTNYKEYETIFFVLSIVIIGLILFLDYFIYKKDKLKIITSVCIFLGTISIFIMIVYFYSLRDTDIRDFDISNDGGIKYFILVYFIIQATLISIIGTQNIKYKPKY